MPRSNLRPSLRGWLSKDQPGNLVLYRPPWRKSWVQTIYGESDSTPMLSRSGVVHVLTKSDRNQRLRPQRLSPQRLKPVKHLKPRQIIIALFAGLFSLAIGLMMLESKPAASHDAIGSDVVAVQKTDAECRKYLGDPNLLISNSLEFTDVPGLQATLSGELIYGGVRYKDVELACSEISEAYRLVEVLVDGNWQLKKFAPTR